MELTITLDHLHIQEIRKQVLEKCEEKQKEITFKRKMKENTLIISVSFVVTL